MSAYTVIVIIFLMSISLVIGIEIGIYLMHDWERVARFQLDENDRLINMMLEAIRAENKIDGIYHDKRNI